MEGWQPFVFVVEAGRACYNFGITSERFDKRITRVMYRIPLVFAPQPEGGYTVTSTVLPELLTEGNSLDEAQANVRDAFEAVIELYEEQGRSLPASVLLPSSGEVVCTEILVGSR